METVFKTHVGQGKVKENILPPFIFTLSMTESATCTGICYLFQAGLLTHATVRSSALISKEWTVMGSSQN